MFTKLTEHMAVASFSQGKSRIIVFRYIDGNDIWEHIPNTQALLIGGPAARRELQTIFRTISRPKFKELMPDGISSGTHSAIREWLGLPVERGRPKKAQSQEN